MSDEIGLNRARGSNVTTIVTPSYQGHRLAYVRLIAELAIARGERVQLISSRGCRSSAEFDTHLSRCRSSIEVVELSQFSLPTIRGYIPTSSAGRTVFPDGDSWLVPFLTHRGTWPGGVTLLIMRPAGQSVRRWVRVLQTVSKSITRQMVRGRRGVRVFELATAAKSVYRKFEVPDPVEFRSDNALAARYRETWSAPVASIRPRYWFGVVGAINARKNIALVAKSIGAEFSPDEVGFVLAGQSQSSEALVSEWMEPLRAAQIPTVRVDEVLSDSDLDAVIQALDCVILAHSNEGPSGILGKALSAGTRVVGAGAASLRADARLNPDAMSWAPLDAGHLSRALRRASTETSPRARTHTGPDFAKVLL